MGVVSRTSRTFVVVALALSLAASVLASSGCVRRTSSVDSDKQVVSAASVTFLKALTAGDLVAAKAVAPGVDLTATVADVFDGRDAREFSVGDVAGVYLDEPDPHLHTKLLGAHGKVVAGSFHVNIVLTGASNGAEGNQATVHGMLLPDRSVAIDGAESGPWSP